MLVHIRQCFKVVVGLGLVSILLRLVYVYEAISVACC